MRRRLYYLLPDLPSARKIMDDLLLARIEERHIHFLAKRGTPMDGLHEANILQKSDLVHGAQRGVLIGAALGCALGFLITLTADRSRMAGRARFSLPVPLARCSEAGLRAWSAPRSPIRA